MVEALWKGGERKTISRRSLNKMAPLHCVDASSILLSLERPYRAATIAPRSDITHLIQPDARRDVHRFEEVINGREYQIEVSSVGLGQWRAQIARRPGGSAALMPFYGKTPDEAASQLSRWLALANGQPHPRP